MNSLFAIIEIVASHGGPQPWIHMVFLVIIAALYLAVAYINHAVAGFYSTFSPPYHPPTAWLTLPLTRIFLFI